MPWAVRLLVGSLSVQRHSITRRVSQPPQDTHCVLEVGGHAHAELHLPQGQLQTVTHLLPTAQQHLRQTHTDTPQRLTQQS